MCLNFTKEGVGYRKSEFINAFIWILRKIIDCWWPAPWIITFRSWNSRSGARTIQGLKYADCRRYRSNQSKIKLKYDILLYMGIIILWGKIKITTNYKISYFGIYFDWKSALWREHDSSVSWMRIRS